MLVFARSPHDAVVSALLPGGVGTISATSRSGWTAAWAPDVGPLRGLGELVAIDDEDFDEVSLRVESQEVSGAWVWRVDESETSSPDVQAATEALCRVFGVPDRLADAGRMLQDAVRSGYVGPELEEIFDLPCLEGPDRRRVVTLHHGDPMEARMAARIAAREIGSAEIGSLSDGWSVARTDQGSRAQFALACGLAAGSSKRGATVVTLWRGDGAAAGFELLDANGGVVHGSWNTGWRDLAEGWQSRDAEAHALAERIGGSAVDLVALRALMRADTWTADPLAELVSLLRLPASALAVLDDDVDAPPLEAAKPASVWQATREAISEMDGEPRITARWLRVTIGALALLIALVALLAAVVGWCAVATNGAFVDQDGLSTGDWLFTLACTVMGPVNAWSGVQLIRRGTFF